jgi:miniconductance mechanosensitive channel
MFETLDINLINGLQSLGIPEILILPVAAATKLIVLFLISYIAFKVANRYILKLLNRLTEKTKSNWDDILVERRVFNRLAYLVPSYLLYFTLPFALVNYPDLLAFFLLAIRIYSIIILMLVGNAFLESVLHIYNQYEISKSKPIKGYVQVGKIVIYILATISVIAILIGKSPFLLIGGLGAFSAVLLLVFKDTLLGLVAGVQLTANDMLRAGDWISLPKYDADGTVTDITLTTVKIQNWDRTISTIPAYALFTESFKNWRGMEESGGRRIKRSINIDMNSVKFCTQQMLEKYKQFQHIVDYIENKEVEIQQYNVEKQINTKVLVNGRRQTNIGVFRAYLNAFLRNHPDIHQNMTFLIRHLQPTEHGLPIEVYVFSNKQAWAVYEAVQADIFDHILAVVPEFDLRVFQNPTGSDFKSCFTSKNQEL